MYIYIQYIVCVGVFFTFLYRLIFNRGHSRFYTLATPKTIQTNPKPPHLKISQIHSKTPQKHFTLSFNTLQKTSTKSQPTKYPNSPYTNFHFNSIPPNPIPNPTPIFHRKYLLNLITQSTHPIL